MKTATISRPSATLLTSKLDGSSSEDAPASRPSTRIRRVRLADLGVLYCPPTETVGQSTGSQSCLRDCLDFAEKMKRKALRVRSEGSIPPYVTEAESRKQHSDSPLCNSLLFGQVNK